MFFSGLLCVEGFSPEEATSSASVGLWLQVGFDEWGAWVEDMKEDEEWRKEYLSFWFPPCRLVVDLLDPQIQFQVLAPANQPFCFQTAINSTPLCPSACDTWIIPCHFSTPAHAFVNKPFIKLDSDNSNFVLLSISYWDTLTRMLSFMKSCWLSLFDFLRYHTMSVFLFGSCCITAGSNCPFCSGWFPLHPSRFFVQEVILGFLLWTQFPSFTLCSIVHIYQPQPLPQEYLN